MRRASLLQAASLAAGLPKPASWHPGSKSRYYARRTSRIERMVAKASFLGRYVGGSPQTEVAILEPERSASQPPVREAPKGAPPPVRSASPAAPAAPERPGPVASAEMTPRAEAYVPIEPAPAEISSDDTMVATAALNATVERIARRDPAQYQWTYKRYTLHPSMNPYLNPYRDLEGRA